MTKTTTVASKAFVAVVAAAMVFSLIAPAAKAQTASAADLQAQITALMAQISALQGGGNTTTTTTTTSTCAAIPAPLTMNASGANVTALQNWLISAGQSIPAGATGYFGAQTRSALAAWQSANGVMPAVGYYGPITAAAVAAKCVPTTPTTPGTGTGTTPTTPGTSTDLSGEGTLDTFEIDEEETEVSEGAEDEVVMTITAEAVDGDIELSRMTFTLTSASTTLNEENDPWDVFEEVALWVDGKKVADFDASDEDNYLNEDKGEFRFSDIGLVLMEDEEVEISVALTIAGSVDGSDTANAAAWILEPTEVRYFDADGVASTEDSVDEMTSGVDTAEQAQFDIEEEGTDDDAQVKSNSSDPDAATLRVEDDSKESDEYSIFVFDIEVDEDSSDLTLDNAFVDINVTNPAGGVTSFSADDVIAKVMLTIDGETVTGDESNNADFIAAIGNSASNSVRFEFDFDGMDLEADTDYEVELMVTFEGRDTNAYDLNTLVQASVDGTVWEVEGLNNDNVLTGSETGNTHSLAEVVPLITSVTPDVNVDEPNDSGTISFTFKVEADGDDDIVGFDVNDIVRTLTSTASTSVTPTVGLTKTGGDATLTSPGVYTINEGDDATFAVDFTYTTASSANNGTYRVTVDTILGVEVDVTSAGLSLSN